MFAAVEGDLTQEVGEKKSPNFCLAAWKSAALLDCVSPLPGSALPSPLTLPPLPKQAEDHPLPHSQMCMEGAARPGWEWGGRTWGSMPSHLLFTWG